MYWVVTSSRQRPFYSLDRACNYGATLDLCGIGYVVTDRYGNILD